MERFILIPKSRQLTFTWWSCAIALYDALFFPSRLTFIQNRREEDSKSNIKRIVTMYERLPQWMQTWQPVKLTELTINLPRSRSEIRGIPAGPQHTRGSTLTMMISDEMAYTDQMDEVIAAVKPALGKTGRFLGISSATPSYFKQLVFDEI